MAGWRARLAVLVAAAGALLLLPVSGRGDAVLASEEYRLLPLRFHLLRAQKARELGCRLQVADARRILGKINGIWKQAGIQFYEESIVSEEAANQELYAGLGENRTEGHLRLIRPRESLSSEVFHLYYIRQMRPNGICLQSSYELLFVKDTAQLNEVPGGIDEPLPRVSAHEIGHALSLGHRQDTFNLMASGTTGTGLNAAEIAAARAAAARWSWCLQPADALKLADRHAAEKRAEPAAGLYTALAALPGGEIAQAARRRLADLGR